MTSQHDTDQVTMAHDHPLQPGSDGLSALQPPGTLTAVAGTLTLADLPPTDTGRWVARRKAQVVAAVGTGLITLDEACRRYALSAEEFLSWQKGLADQGLAGLRRRGKRQP